MARPSKDAKHITFNLKSEVVEMVNTYYEQTSISKRLLLRKLWENISRTR